MRKVDPIGEEEQEFVWQVCWFIHCLHSYFATRLTLELSTSFQAPQNLLRQGVDKLFTVVYDYP